MVDINGDIKPKKYEKVKNGFGRIIKPTETNLTRKTLIDLNTITHGIGKYEIKSNDLEFTKFKISNDQYKKSLQFIYNNQKHKRKSLNNRRLVRNIFK
ncbi:MAG: hypothetical protein AB7E61_06115 [Acholeplasmataceae bacterium]